MELMQDNQVLISAIIPIAGFPNGLEQITRWISNPSLSDFEVILIVDSDSEDLRFQVDAIAKKIRHTTKVSILNSTSRNPGGSRNLGLKAAIGSWITFWDCDDVPDPTKFLEIVKEAQRRGADVAVGAFSVITEKGEILHLIESDDRSNILRNVALNPGLWRFAFRKELAKNCTFPELRMAEDQMYLAAVLSKSRKIVMSNEQLYEYWLFQSGQLTKNKGALADIQIAIRHFEKKYHENECPEFLIILLRLSLTSLKKGNLRSKQTSLITLIKIAFFDLRRIPLIARTIVKILGSK
jgi:glycosyltransferase involved in cell wall biosynthesis